MIKDPKSLHESRNAARRVIRAHERARGYNKAHEQTDEVVAEIIADLRAYAHFYGLNFHTIQTLAQDIANEREQDLPEFETK